MRTICILLVATVAHGQDNWPQFRGPGARGVADGASFPERWSATENVAWKADIPGRGWSSPVVWGGCVFLTTVINRGDSEPPKKGLYLGGNRPQPPASVHEWWVYCLDLESGNVRWKEKVHEGQPSSPIHIKNSYASETPVTDGEQVYFYFGNIGVFAYDLDGKCGWSKPMEPHRTRYGWGTAASPVLHGDRLYIVNDNEEASWLLALDKRTGKEIWRVDRDEKSNWSTPFVWQNVHRAEIITPGSGKVRAYALDGKELWSLQGMSGITIATPFAGDDLLYVTSGFVGSRLRPIYAIRPGANGDISLSRGQASNASIAWCQPFAAPYNPSTLLYQGRLYVLLDRGTFSAYDAKTGAALYERERIPEGRAFTASPWAADGKIYCLDEDGVTHVLRAGDVFEFLHANRLAHDDMGMATPAIVGGRLLIRTSARLYCIANGTKAPSSPDVPGASASNGASATAGDFKPRPHGDGASKAGLKPDMLAKLDIALQQAVEDQEVSGVIGLIHRNGVRGYFEAFGWQDIEAEKPLPKGAIFRLQSMTKPIIAACAMALYDEGKFTLDEPISKRCPEWKEPKVLENGQLVPAKYAIAPRMLTSHSSGLYYGDIEKGADRKPGNEGESFAPVATTNRGAKTTLKQFSEGLAKAPHPQIKSCAPVSGGRGAFGRP